MIYQYSRLCNSYCPASLRQRGKQTDGEKHSYYFRVSSISAVRRVRIS